VKEALCKVDRKDFVNKTADYIAYADTPQSISYNATISAPHMHAHATVRGLILNSDYSEGAFEGEFKKWR
jgi:protein-L-isoaspartate O-methyltransferase